VDIAFVTRSRFLSDCEVALQNGRATLDSGGVVRVAFEDGGYPGGVVVTIRSDNTTTFGTDWEGTDDTRFPARIKAAATALYNCGFVGRFLVVHADGALEVSADAA
jgi:hypothetical protein